MLAGAGQMMRSIGGAMFAMQLGQVVGQLSSEVVSGGDIGIPLLPDGTAALLPQNVAEFGEGLDIRRPGRHLPRRPRAGARAAVPARALAEAAPHQLHHRVLARDAHRHRRTRESRRAVRPANPEQLRETLTNGSLIPPKTDAQLAALARLETMLALVEGWVDVVTAAATKRLPRAIAHGRDGAPAPRGRRPGRVGVRDPRRSGVAPTTSA